nr:PREDICTED: verrucotoxin subunit beta-like [Lepisosteus oculatus]XP_015215174.1 PREDICTED: verrucotoxin subunit beta-like [Lepisosteus oculatus]
MSADKNDTIELASLGRPFQLGMLYDCRSDSLIPGVTLWELNKIKESIDVRSQRNSNFQVITSDSIEEKTSSLDVSASLKVSVLGGMISVQGSAGFLNDNKSSKHQARITLHYRTTTKFEQLTMNQLGQQNIAFKEVFDQGTATHVVTGVLYGAQAFFVFDREISSDETKQGVQGSMEGAIKMMGLIGGEVKGSVNVNTKTDKTVDQIKCTFYGDFKLTSNPVTFQEAIQVYSKLPNLLGPEEEHAVPIKVWLYPLKLLNDQAARLVREISVELVYHAQNILEHLGHCEMKSNDLMKNEVASKFRQIKRKAQRFKDLCRIYKLTFQKNLAEVLPQIRGGQQEENKLADILKRKEESPFKDSSLVEWLENKETEKNVVKAYLKLMKDIKVMVNRSELEEQILDPTGQYVLCFVFTSLHEEEPYLEELLKFLRTQESELHVRASSQEQWFSSETVSLRMRELAKRFLEFWSSNNNSKSKFLIASEMDTDHRGVSIYLYEEGRLVNKDFHPPSKPEAPLVVERSHNSITLKLTPPAYGSKETVQYKVYYTDSEQTKNVSDLKEWKFVETCEVKECFTVSGLSPHKKYMFRYAAVTKLGKSTASDSVTASTLPAGPPRDFGVLEEGHTRIKIEWAKPETIADQIVRNYIIEYKKHGTEKWTSEVLRVKEECQTIPFEMRDLTPDTTYSIRVLASCGDDGIGAPSKVLQATTKKIRYLERSDLLRSEEPALYKLHLQEQTVDEEQYTRLCTLAQLEDVCCDDSMERTILVLGTRAHYKAMLINAMFNYILGVSFEDDYRFVVTDPACSEVDLDTQWMTIYKIVCEKGFRIPYTLTIIDAPAYGEWHQRNLLIEEQIRTFTERTEISGDLNAVCLVVENASDNPTAAHCVFHSEAYLKNEDFYEEDKETCDSRMLFTTETGFQFYKSDNLKHFFTFSSSGLFDINRNAEEKNKQKELWKMALESIGLFFTELNDFKDKHFITYGPH